MVRTKQGHEKWKGQPFPSLGIPAEKHIKFDVKVLTWTKVQLRRYESTKIMLFLLLYFSN